MYDHNKLPETPSEKAAFVKLKFETELKEHFKSEEEILFPFVKGRKSEIDLLIAELIDEHRKLESGIAGIEESQNQISELDALGRLLEIHIRKEELQLFQLIQDTLSEKELLILEEKLSGS